MTEGQTMLRHVVTWLCAVSPAGGVGLRGRRHVPPQEEETDLRHDGQRRHQQPGRLRQQGEELVPVTPSLHPASTPPLTNTETAASGLV